MSLPALWITFAVPAPAVAKLAERFDVVHTKGHGPEALAEAQKKPIVSVLTNGASGLHAAAINGLPNLKSISTFGAGYENVDLSAARARGVVVTHAPGVNDANVADHAVGLMLGIARDFVAGDRAVREGKWDQSRAYRPSLNNKRVGIIGLGNIGMRIARRCEAFDMTVAYNTRTPRSGVAWQHYSDLVKLAEDSEYLVAACPGGPATRHIVNAQVLEALGPEGFFVNIARGSVVDTAALIDALERGVIAGAGLDVVEGEPVVPEGLLKSNKVLFTPHMAGRTPDVVWNQVKLFTANAEAVLAGKTPPNPVPV
ncbi:MAG TPA: 2-hydroxyacid dehydrogenase [Burkholderiales bacterium]|jgi:lactate dehydrogenase-like 2-hydroxyacid dehydrogenase|nr:2-hydroxyacid dehydrogenase [Burkholderiales bacterium]